MIDLSRVSHLAERRRIKRLLALAWRVNERRIQELADLHGQDREAFRQLQVELEAARKRFEQDCDAAQQRCDAARERLDPLLEAAEAPFTRRFEALQDRVERVGLKVRNQDKSVFSIPTCAITGLPLLESDETWKHHDHGEALMVLMPPPDHAPDGDVEAAEPEDVVEFARAGAPPNVVQFPSVSRETSPA